MYSFPLSSGMSVYPVQWGSETSSLLARAGRRDPSVVASPFWTTTTVNIPQGEKREIFTYGPGCAITVAILSMHGDGIRGVTLSSYPSAAIAHQQEAIRQALETFSHSPSLNSRHEILFIIPTDCVDRGGETWVLPENRQTVIQGIRETIERHLPDIRIKLLSYPSERRFGESRSFILQVPAEPGQPIRYRGIDSGVCSF